jgi:hypothetical protein
VNPPVWLTPEELAVWQAWAPHAISARTLTSSTAGAFADLCRAVVTRDRMWATIEKDGLTFISVRVDGAGTEHPELKKHPLLPDHRGWAMRVEAAWARFRLAPVGRELAVPEQPADPFEEFSSPLTVVRGGKA